MLVEPIMNRLESAGLGTIGQSIFGHYMPAEVRSGILVLSSLAGNSISYETPGFRMDDRFQVIVRDTTAQNAMDVGRSVRDALVATERFVMPSGVAGVPNMLVSYIRPISDPILFPRAQSGLFECSLNSEITYAFTDRYL
jgi:hypothetical protein